MVLDEILAHKHNEIDERQSRRSIDSVASLAAAARPPRDFVSALCESGISLIAEVKHKSPSKGVLRQGFEPVALSRTYAGNGARAISVLADRKFFGGGSDVVERVANDSEVGVPVLFKDFVVTPYQVYEARSVGADAVLLIVRAVQQTTLARLLKLTQELGMAALTEVFTASEAKRALAAGASVIGVNNRNLQTFTVDMRNSEEIRAILPGGVVSVSESGISSRRDVIRAEEAGFDGILVGEVLVKAPDVAHRVRELLGQEEGEQVEGVR